ncbi:MAG: ABC transporter permease subunit [Firmicutes bacterium]|nr:ABC transporter permease subunit [Bacillota bacterium]
MERKLNISGILFFVAILIYLVNICGILGTVVFNSISKGWYSGIFPQHFTLEWYRYMANEHDLPQLLLATFTVTIVVVFVSLLIAFPTAYGLARYDFRLKGALLSALLLPMIVPPMAYGIPLATVLYRFHLATRLSGVIVANLVPIVPFMILILTPFIEQIGVNLEAAARILGASKVQTFFRVLVPLSLPGILTAGILAVVRTISMFELTFLVAGPKSQTIVVALYSDAYAAGARPPQAIDALAVVYFLIAMICLIVALKFTSPTQMVFKVK